MVKRHDLITVVESLRNSRKTNTFQDLRKIIEICSDGFNDALDDMALTPYYSWAVSLANNLKIASDIVEYKKNNLHGIKNRTDYFSIGIIKPRFIIEKISTGL